MASFHDGYDTFPVPTCVAQSLMYCNTLDVFCPVAFIHMFLIKYIFIHEMQLILWLKFWEISKESFRIAHRKPCESVIPWLSVDTSSDGVNRGLQGLQSFLYAILKLCNATHSISAVCLTLNLLRWGPPSCKQVKCESEPCLHGIIVGTTSLLTMGRKQEPSSSLPAN